MGIKLNAISFAFYFIIRSLDMCESLMYYFCPALAAASRAFREEIVEKPARSLDRSLGSNYLIKGSFSI
jgi:hypothetical protein